MGREVKRPGGGGRHCVRAPRPVGATARGREAEANDVRPTRAVQVYARDLRGLTDGARTRDEKKKQSEMAVGE